MVRLAQVWRLHVWVYGALGAALGYGAVWNAGHAGHRHQQVPIPAQLAAVFAILAAFVVYLVLKGHRGGIEVGPGHIVVRRCWLPNRQFSWDEVQGYVRVHHYTGGGAGAGRMKLTYLAVLLTSGYHVKTEGLATITGRWLMGSKTTMRLNDAESQLRELGLRYRSARHTSLLAWLLRRGQLTGAAARPGQIRP